MWIGNPAILSMSRKNHAEWLNRLKQIRAMSPHQLYQWDCQRVHGHPNYQIAIRKGVVWIGADGISITTVYSPGDSVEKQLESLQQNIRFDLMNETRAEFGLSR